MRESSGAGKIGTTGKGIGPAYEDKVARRALRVQDLKHPERFATKLRELLDLHNFALEGYFHAAPLEFQPIFDDGDEGRRSAQADDRPTSATRSTTPTAPAPTCCSKARRARCSTSTTAPIRYVTSSNCVAGNAAAGSGVGPDHAALHPRHHQGVHDARRRRAVPDRAADRRAGHRSATTCRRSARSAAR